MIILIYIFDSFLFRRIETKKFLKISKLKLYDNKKDKSYNVTVAKNEAKYKFFYIIEIISIFKQIMKLDFELVNQLDVLQKII